ncbi:MAG: Ig-like domain-containing protein, partial [Oscillospiraceae bacterium]|nr:Ig-like domain-containing protein [Oscillospiraceae bacterium]
MRNKRLVSMLLALSMLLSLLPTGFVSANTNASEGYEYVFKLEALGSQASDGYRSKLATMTLETPLSSVSDPWKVAASRFLYNVYSQPEGILWNGDKSYATGGNSMFAVEISVPTGGTYKPSLRYSAIKSAPIVDVYLVKEGTKAGGYYPSDFQFVTSGNGDAKTSAFIRGLGDDYKLGQVDMWGGSTTTDYKNIVTESFGDLELQLDENSKYYLCFHTVGLNENHVGTSSNTYYNVNLESFRLAPPVEKPVDELSSFSLSSSSDSVSEGGTATLTATAVYSLSGTKILTEGVTYKSSDENILKVSPEGVITGVSKGTAKITATANGTSFSDEIEITVKATEEATEEHKYVFTKAAFGSPEGNYVRSKLAEMTLETPLSSVSDQWRVAGSNCLYNVYAQTEGIVWNGYTDDAKNGVSTFVVEISVPTGGTYKPSLSYSAIKSAPIVDIFLVKKGSKVGDYSTDDIKFASSGNNYDSTSSFINALGDDFKLGQVDLWGTGSYTNIKTESFGDLELQLDGNSKYYLCFRTVGVNTNYVGSSNGTYFYVCLESFKLKPLAGDYDKACISVHGLLNENDPMPNMTEKQIEYKLYDDIGIEIENIDEAELSATYSSSDENIATVSESGLITAHSNGETKITADITYKGVSRTAEYNLSVASAGRNMMANLNPDFEEDKWVWDSTRNDEAPADPVFFRSGIEVAPKDGDEDNRALAFTFNPDVPMPTHIKTIFLKRNGERVVVEPDKLYQLTFKVKTDIKKPQDGDYPTINYSMYAYNNPSGNTGTDLSYVSGRATDINSFENWEEKFSEWQEVVLPISINSNCTADMLYLSPRLVLFSPELSIGKTGYSGTIWMDDFELREVGYAGLEMEITGDTTAAGEGNFTVLSKPYTTLGHYISVDSGCLSEGLEMTSSDEYVVSDFGDSTTFSLGIQGNIASTVAECGGKNGAATIFGELTINGITRRGEVPVKTSGYEMKLLYAELVSEKTAIDVGKTTAAIPTGFMSDGSVADMTGGSILYQSLTPEIVSIDESGNVTALRAGKGKISATFILGENSAYAECEIKVTDDSPIYEAYLSGPGTVGYLRDEPLVLTGKMESGYDADFTNADIKWIIGSDIENSVEIIDGNLVFGNVKGATAKIKAEITLGGATVTTNEVEVTVVETDMRDFILNFGGVAEKKIKDVTIDEYGWQVDWNLSHSTVKNTILKNTYAYVITDSVDRNFTVDFSVPYTGNYTPVFVSGLTNGYGAEYVYIYIDGKYVGETSFCVDNLRDTTNVLNLRSLSLEKGNHKLTLRPYSKTEVSRNYYMYPGNIRFAAITELPDVQKIITSKDSLTLEVEQNEDISAKLKLTDGFVYAGETSYEGKENADVKISYASADSDVAEVSADGTVTAKAVGETVITVTGYANGKSEPKEIQVKVVEKGMASEKKTLDKVEIEAPFFVMNPETEGVQLEAIGKDENGEAVDINGAEITWNSENESVAEVSDKGYVTPKSLGSAKISVTVIANGIEKTGETYISVREGKVGRTYFTDEMVAAAQENITKYNWAKSEAKSVIESSERYLGLEDELWEMVPGEGIPRAMCVGFRNDPDRYTCRYCGVNLTQNYGSYGWISNPLQRPWKIQCPECKRVFPSNDFESFYELGRDEHGIFNRELALQRHQEMFGGTYGTGYLKNTLYPEVGTEESGVKLTGNETPEKWGVDDGFGYDTGRVYSNGCKEIHTYIAYYNHYGLWYESGSNNPGMISATLSTLSKAYMYTGDEKYGRVGAILLDRVADVYPGYDLRPYLMDYSNSDGGSKRGKIVGAIWEIDPANAFAESYDALFPMYDDPYVVSFLAEKATKYNNTEKNDKSAPEKIRKNIEDGVLREIYREVQRSSIQGNFGFHQATLARAAIVLDNYPETDEMFDWLFRYSETDYTSRNTGGEINKRLIGGVSRDGQGDESGPGYNRIWVTQITEVASVLAKYDEGEGVNLYENPKFVEMVKSYAPLTLVRRGLAAIGDSGVAGMHSLLPDDDSVMINAFKETGDIEIAQHLYFLKDGKLDELHYDIFTRNPESLENEIEEIIEKHGEYNYDKSSLLSGYGFGVLRDGTLHKSDTSVGIRDTQRDFWMYFGGARSHTHADRLGLGIEAYGLPLTTDLGYPETAGTDPNRNQWQSATISHNTVVVNEKSQDTTKYSGVPLHFDTKDTRVKVMDVDASVVYATADEYRRTIVMVDYDDEISYGIDFFKILGGNDHLYSFHAFSDEDPEVSDNINLKTQVTGSYAGVSVMYGEDPWSSVGNADVVLKYPVGYTWLDDVKRANNPGTGEFFVDFKIKDFWKQSRNAKQDIHLRMTMVNDWAADEVSLVNGRVPRKVITLSAGIDSLEYMLVRRKGRDLNTLFTTVMEPYDGSRYIKSIENVPVSVVSGTPGKTDAAKAVKVELIDGRIDYIVYAQNNSVTYNVGDIFTFRGFVGVWTTDANGVNIYSYVNDGEMIGDNEFKHEDLDAAIKGTITDFQDELSFDNWIEAELDCELTQEEADDLSGRIINVEREALGNSTYVIESVEMLDSTHARINLGNITLINSFVDYKNEDLGYKYDVAVGKTFDIPMSYEDNPAPVFDEVPDSITTSAGSSVAVTVKATGDEGATVTYQARTLPRGASFNGETGTFNWKPDNSQIGDNLVAIDAVDEYGRISTQYFTVTVYGSTTGKPSNKTEENTGTSSEGTAGGGGGGGGGAAPETPSTGDD